MSKIKQDDTTYNFIRNEEQKQATNNWICTQAKGESILEIECSQGDTVIKLARESKRVVGIDTSLENVERARQFLEKENNYTQNSASFEVRSLLVDLESDRVYDSIIFNNLLYTVTEVKRYIKKAAQLLNDNGRIIITVPFGIKDPNISRKPFYFNELKEFKTESLCITKISYIGEDIGVVLESSDLNSSNELIHKSIQELEEAFMAKEKKYIEQAINIENKSLNSKVTQDLPETKRDPNNINGYFLNKQGKKVTNREYEKITKELAKVKKEMDSFRRMYVKEKKEKVKQGKLLLNAYKKEERLLKTYSSLQDRYHALSNSKLGKLTLKYWAWRRKRRKR